MEDLFNPDVWNTGDLEPYREGNAILAQNFA